MLIQSLDVCVGYLGTGIPSSLAHLVYLAIRFIQVIIPILLIIWGMLDLGKAVMAQKEDEIKKGQQTFIKRLIAAAIVFFVVTVVLLMINLIGSNIDSDNANNLSSCIKSIVSCSSSSCN